MSETANTPRRSAKEILADISRPDSLLSRYVRPLPDAAAAALAATETALQTRRANNNNEYSRAPAPVAPQTPRAAPADSAAPHSGGALASKRARPHTPGGGGGGGAAAAGSVAAAVPVAPASPSAPARASVRFSSPPSSARPTAAFGRSVAAVSDPHAADGPYRSPLQRALLLAEPSYTPAQLDLHSKFAPSFYVGPRCLSLEEDDAGGDGDGMRALPLRTQIVPVPPPPLGTRAKAALASAEAAAAAERRAAIASGALPHTPNAQLPLSPSSALGSAAHARASVSFAQAGQLDRAQSELLASAFDSIDDAYPPPGTLLSRPHRRAAEEILASAGSDRGGGVGLTRLEREAAEQALALSAPPHGGRRQLVPRGDSSSSPSSSPTTGGVGGYDVFTLPFGFRVVRDDSIDPSCYGGAAAPSPDEQADLAAARSDPAVKERIRGVLGGIAARYELDPPDSVSPGQQGPAQGAEEKQQYFSQQQQQQRRPPPLFRTGSIATTGSQPQPHSRPGTALPSPQAQGGGKAFSAPPPGGVERAELDGSAGASSLPDQNEIVRIDYDALAAEKKNKSSAPSSSQAGGSRKAKAKKKAPGGTASPAARRDATQLFGKSLHSGGRSGKIRPSRGIQLVSSIPAPLRACCVVERTGTVWTAQREPVLVVRDRLSGAVKQRIDTPGLVLAMLLVETAPTGSAAGAAGVGAAGSDAVMWVGTETGALLVYNIFTLQRLRQVVHHAGAIHALARALPPLGCDGATAATAGVFSASIDFTMILWDAQTLAVKQSYTGHAGGVRCVLPLSAGRVWSGGDDGAIRVWDVQTGACIEELVRHSGSVLSLLCTGSHVWSAAEDGTLAQWSLSPRLACVRQVATGSDRISALLLVGGQVWSCGQDPRVHVWSAERMEWLGALDGHIRYVSALATVRVMESRAVWSHGLGDGRALVWRSEQLAAGDPAVTIAQMRAQITTQADEMAALRLRAEAAEAAAAASELRRAEQEAAFQAQLDSLVLQLARALAGRDAAQAALLESQKFCADLAEQNARLRNELRLHVEKVTVAEALLRDSIDRIETKEEHIARLQADQAAQERRAREKRAAAEAECARMAALLAGGDGAMAELTAQLAAARARQAEAERRQAEGAAALALLQAESERLRTELHSSTARSSAAAESSRLRTEALQAQTAGLERGAVDAALQQREADAVAQQLRAELQALREAHERAMAERAQAAQSAAAALASARAVESRANSSAAHAAQSARSSERRIRALQSARDAAANESDRLRALLGLVAREMRAVERRLRQLSRPDCEVYSAPRHQPRTLQALAVARAAGTDFSFLSAPPAPLFAALAQCHSAAATVMQRCLDALNRLHVGFAPSAEVRARVEAEAGSLDAQPTAQLQAADQQQQQSQSPSRSPSQPQSQPNSARAAPPRAHAQPDSARSGSSASRTPPLSARRAHPFPSVSSPSPSLLGASAASKSAAATVPPARRRPAPPAADAKPATAHARLLQERPVGPAGGDPAASDEDGDCHSGDESDSESDCSDDGQSEARSDGGDPSARPAHRSAVTLQSDPAQSPVRSVWDADA